LTFPILIAFAPVLLKALPGDDLTHRTLAVAIGFVGILAFRSGYRVHRRRWLLYLFCLGLLLVSLAAVLGEAVLTNYGESGITVCGGLLLVTAHLFNRSFCRSCAVHDCRHSCPSLGADVPQVQAGTGVQDSR
jgi:peptidoglycan/LPS O-acetylase OafA/YrhL